MKQSLKLLHNWMWQAQDFPSENNEEEDARLESATNTTVTFFNSQLAATKGRSMLLLPLF